jgi:hypothetical protein
MAHLWGGNLVIFEGQSSAVLPANNSYTIYLRNNCPTFKLASIPYVLVKNNIHRHDKKMRYRYEKW